MLPPNPLPPIWLETVALEVALALPDILSKDSLVNPASDNSCPPKAIYFIQLSFYPVFLLFLLLPIFFLFFNFIFIYQSMHNLTFYTTSFFVPCSSLFFSVSFPLLSLCPSLHFHHFFLPTISSSLLPSCHLPISPSFSPLSLHFSISPSFYNPFLLPSLYLTVLPTISLSPILSFHPFLFLLFPHHHPSFYSLNHLIINLT